MGGGGARGPRANIFWAEPKILGVSDGFFIWIKGFNFIPKKGEKKKNYWLRQKKKISGQ
jgi:hypothetical protein